MFVDVIKLPPVHGLPRLERTALLASLLADSHYAYRDPHTSIPMDYDPNAVLLGSDVSFRDTPLIKTVHVSPDGKWVFEAVIAVYHDVSWYIYVKLLGPRRDVAIAFHTVESYRASSQDLSPLSQIMWSESYHHSPMYRPVTIDQIIPPLFIERGLMEDAPKLWDLIWQHVPMSCTADRYEPILRYEPGLFDALVKGAPERPPHCGVLEHFPYIQIPRGWNSKWSQLQMSPRSGMEVLVNHELFDNPALDVTVQRPTQFSISILLKDIVEGLFSLSGIHSLDDPYHQFVQPEKGVSQWITQDLGKIFREAMARYCLIHGISMSAYLDEVGTRSYLTVEKTLGDEISFTFNDMVYDRFVCFYCNFPLIALGTKSVGTVVR